MTDSRNLDPKTLDAVLDAALDDLRGQELPPHLAEQAAARVRQRLAREIPGFSATRPEPATRSGPDEPSPSVLRDCKDFQALIPAYLAGTLPASRRLLLEDHSRSCLPCRRALQQARKGEAATATAPAKAAPSTRYSPALRWAAVAVLTVGLGWTAWMLLDLLPIGPRPSARIAALEGELYHVAADGFAPLAVGQDLPFGETVRSAKGSGAVVRLADGTQIEMSARSELVLAQRRQGTTIELGRGNIIVEAAPQGAGKLFVATDDCLVTVKGTIFSVNRGTKGSRVSVMEGRVVVDYGAREAVLDPGGQVSTHPSLGPVPVSREISWSRHFDEYLELMRELGALSEEIDEALTQPELRYDTRLLDLMPAGTVFYAAVPNLSSNLRQAYQTIQERIASSPALESWWQESVASAQGQEALEQALTEITRLGGFLGSELTLSLSASDRGSQDASSGDAAAGGDRGVAKSLLLAAATNDPAGLRAYVDERVEEQRASAGAGTFPLVVVEDPLLWQPLAEGEQGLLLWISDDLVALALEIDTLRELEANLLSEGGSHRAFLAHPFRQSLAEAYADGADWLVGADMGRILDKPARANAEILEQAGILDVDTLILERKKSAGAPVHYRAQLRFDGPRRGIASWLEAPAPMGSLDFVSPDVNFVSAALTKEPRQVVEELLSLLELAAPDLRQRIEDLEAENGLRLVDDFAAPLGGEITFALDGPVLPTPSWKLIAEVYDADRLQSTVRRLVELVNAHSERSDGLLRLEESRSGGITFHALRSTQASLGIYYAFVDGYLLAGPSTALIERAVQLRDAGYTLVDSARFTALLPLDGQVNFSGLTYQNLESVLGPLAQLWSQRGSQLSGDQRQGLQEVLARTPATLTCFYGENDRIIAVSNSERGELSSLLGVSTALGIDRWMSALGKGLSGKGPAAGGAPGNGGFRFDLALGDAPAAPAETPPERAQ